MADFVDDKDMPELKEILNDLLEIDEGLYNSEVNFIEDLCDWDGNFTEAQANWLRQIHERII